MAGITIPIISSANGIMMVNRASKPIRCAIIRIDIAILNTPTRGNDVQLLHYTFVHVIMHCITLKSLLLYSYTSTYKTLWQIIHTRPWKQEWKNLVVS